MLKKVFFVGLHVIIVMMHYKPAKSYYIFNGTEAIKKRIFFFEREKEQIEKLT